MMNALLSPTSVTLLLVAFVVIPLLRFFKPQIKGWFGEILVHQLLTHRLDQNVYRVVRNVMLPTEDGTTQIDHIVVSRYGIFVIETKNYKGWIFGSERQAKWTQKIFRVTNSFQNPIHQNYKHIKTLAELTGIPEPTPSPPSSFWATPPSRPRCRPASCMPGIWPSSSARIRRC
jgi:restriction system protein